MYHCTGPAKEQTLNNYRLSVVLCMDTGQENVFPSLLVYLSFLSNPQVSLALYYEKLNCTQANAKANT